MSLGKGTITKEKTTSGKLPAKQILKVNRVERHLSSNQKEWSDLIECSGHSGETP